MKKEIMLASLEMAKLLLGFILASLAVAYIAAMIGLFLKVILIIIK